MAFNNLPYTNNHELNLDWIITKMKELDVNLQTIEERVKASTLEATKEYVDSQLSNLRKDFEDTKKYIDDKIVELNNNYSGFTKQTQDQIDLMSQRIYAFEKELKASIIGVNARTDQAIAQNNEYLLDKIDKGFINAKVLNPFTGEYVTFQSMVDYLAHFHIEGGLTAGTMATRALTAQQVSELNVTAQNLLLHGDSIYIAA